MNWILNQIEQEKLNKVANEINGEFILDRLCHNLSYKRDYLLQYIDKENVQILLATLLINRGLENHTELLNNPKDYFINPKILHNAELASITIARYANNPNAYIHIYADYDVDGVTSGYVMTNGLREVAKCSVSLKYPNREEGYGLSMEWCKKLVEHYTDEETGTITAHILVMTVDNGITKIQEVDYLKEHGIEVIITDHHTSKDTVPNCIVVNPHNNTIDQGDTFRHLCGCGVAFKVVQLVQELIGTNKMYKYLPYLAIATIADVMPMHTENLAIIQYGLDIINSKNCPVGIAELKKQENIDVVTTTTIGWTIGPMLNACGRMGDTELASKLFFTDDVQIADAVSKIKSVNERRKTITKGAVKQLAKTPNTDDKIFIMNTKKYPSGVLGIIAGKAAELFNKPSIVVTSSTKDATQVHGSARSANGIDLMPIMKVLKEEDLITEYGGHSEAIGIYFKEDNIEAIINRVNELLVVSSDPYSIDDSEVIEDSLIIDEILTLSNLNVVMVALSSLLPTDGRNLRTPTFAITDCEVKAFKVYPSGYMELTLKQGNTILDMSAMGYAHKFCEDILPQLDEKDVKLVHVAGTLSKHFKTKKYVLNIVDIVAA